MWCFCAHLSSYLSLSEPPGKWWSPWKFGAFNPGTIAQASGSTCTPLPKSTFQRISHFSQINIWNLGHVILLFKKKKIYWPALIINYFVIIILKVHTQCRILMGSAYLWEALQPGPRELSADVADFCFCQLLASLAQVLIFMRTFCFWLPGSKNSNPKPICGVAMITSVQQRPFSLPGAQLSCMCPYLCFLSPFFPEPCGPWRAGAQAFQPGPLGTRCAFPPPLPQLESLIKAWLLWPSAPPFVSGFWAFPLRESVPR